MTIAAGFVVRDGILLCADSQYSGWEKVNRDKLFLFPFGASMVAFALSGDEAYGKTAIDDCAESIDGIPQEQHTVWSLRKAIRRSIKRVIDEYSRRESLDQGQKPQFLIAINTCSECALFSSRETAIPRIDRFEFCGSGSYIGQYIMRCFSPLAVEMMTLDQAAIVGHYILATAKRHDLFCGGGSQFLALRGMRASGIKAFEFDASDDHIHKYEYWSKALLMEFCDANLTADGFAKLASEFVKGIVNMCEALRQPGNAYQGLLASLRVHSNASNSSRDQT